MKFVALDSLQREAAYARAANVLRFYLANNLDMEKTIKEFGKQPVVLKPEATSTTDALKALLSNMSRFGISDNVPVATTWMPPDTKQRLLEIVNFVHAIYEKEDSFKQNPILQVWMSQYNIFSSDGNIFAVSSLTNKLLLSEFLVIAMTYILFIVQLLRVLYRKNLKGLPRTIYDSYENFRKNVSMVAFNATVQAAVQHASTLKIVVDTTKSSIDRIKSELEIVETLDKYFDPVTSTYKVQTVQDHLLLPLNAIYDAHKDGIQDEEAKASLERLTKFGTFQRFPKNTAMQTKYLHSMSVAANMLKSHLIEDMPIDAHDVERSYTEWPFEFNPGSVLDI